MKANELRIGNFIELPGIGGGGEKIAGGLAYQAVAVNSLIIQIAEEKGDDFAGRAIPLTEEWLLRFGFQKVNHITNGVFYFHKLIKISVYPNGMVELRGSAGWAKVLYVHQLQNLYFALTGEELELKEK